MIKTTHQKLSVREQCQLLGLSRSGYYYVPAEESEYNLELMNLIDAEYMKKPYYGSPRLTAYLNQKGYLVNIKKVKRLMRLMRLIAIYPKPKTSIPEKSHEIYPYLLRGMKINRSNLVWCSDITYIRMTGGFMYLVTIMDWYSRYVLSWEISNTLEDTFCVSALEKALLRYTPAYSNTDQGSQFTGSGYVNTLKKAGIEISMDGKGRYLDNIMIERLWRSLKYEDIYIKNYASVPDLLAGLGDYFNVYNNERLHQSLDYKTPSQAFLAGMAKGGGPMLN